MNAGALTMMEGCVCFSVFEIKAIRLFFPRAAPKGIMVEPGNILWGKVCILSKLNTGQVKLEL